jgi:hypothetical protein
VQPRLTAAAALQLPWLANHHHHDSTAAGAVSQQIVISAPILSRQWSFTWLLASVLALLFLLVYVCVGGFPPNNPGKAQGVILGREEAVEKAEKNWGTIFILASRRKIASRNLFLVTSKNNSANFSPPTILKNESNTLLIDPRQHLNLF